MPDEYSHVSSQAEDEKIYQDRSSYRYPSGCWRCGGPECHSGTRDTCVFLLSCLEPRTQNPCINELMNGSSNILFKSS